VITADTDAKSIFGTEADEAAEARLDAEAEADYAAGRVLSHERMCEWLTKLAEGERVPPLGRPLRPYDPRLSWFESS
jgi:hypothetical protein